MTNNELQNPAPRSGTAQLLIVDDEPLNARALCDILRDEGFGTTGFTSSKAALDELSRQTFDVLLTDLRMPEMDGITLLREALKIDPNLVGVVMTGHGTIGTAVEAMQCGALDYILKPFKRGEILPVISRSLAVRQLRLENAALQRRVREHVAELETANRELEAFSYSVAHDLSGPLAATRIILEIIVEDCGPLLTEGNQQLLLKIGSGLTRMGEMIQGLLNLSRLGRQALAKRTTNLTVLCQEVLEELAVQHQGRKVETRVAELPACVGDPTLLRQVFRNLLSNAIKYSRGKEEAIIEIGCLERNGEKIYFVRDNGVGFDMQQSKRLFGAFQRLHREEQFEGTGVGLSVVHRIIQRHGGRIWAEAQVGRGATFYFTLEQSPHTPSSVDVSRGDA